MTVSVDIAFDAAVGVYIATSEQLPGLAVEAATLDELYAEIDAAIEDLTEPQPTR